MRRLLPVLALLISAPGFGTIYQMRVCVGDCPEPTREPIVDEPIAVDEAGLTNELFVSFFEERLGPEYCCGGELPFRWNFRGSNSLGYVIGDVDGYMIHTQFVYGHGQLFCCTIDEPYRLYAINDKNMIVGFFPGEGPWVSLGLNADRGEPPSYIPDPAFPDFVPAADGEGYNSYLYGIDNRGNLWGYNSLGYRGYAPPEIHYMLLVPEVVPEPSSLSLVAVAGLLLLAGQSLASRSRPR
jgi:hypothetical protein